jgi:hypothetical protein
LDALPHLRTISISQEWSSIQAIEDWPGFGRLRGDIKVDFKGAISSVLSIREKVSMTPLHFAARDCCEGDVARLIEEGADVNSLDFHKRTPLHYAVAAREPSRAIVSALVTAGTMLSATDDGGLSVRATAEAKHGAAHAVVSLIAEATSGSVVDALFDGVGRVLKEACELRMRFQSLNALEFGKAIQHEDEINKLCATLQDKCQAFENATKGHSDAQQLLREFEGKPDDALARLVGERDSARQQLSGAARELQKSVVDVDEFVSICDALANLKAGIAAIPAQNNESMSSQSRSLTEQLSAWIDEHSSAAAEKSAATARAVAALHAGINLSLCGIGGQSIGELADDCSKAAATETNLLAAIKLPAVLRARLLSKIEDLHGRLARVIETVDNARRARDFSGAKAAQEECSSRLEAAQKLVKKSGIGYERALLDSKDDDADRSVVEEQLRSAKALWSDAQRKVVAATVALAVHVFDFPELHARFPSAKLNQLCSVSGDDTVLRSLDMYELGEVVSSPGARSEVRKATFDSVECVVKIFKLTSAGGRAFMKEAVLLRRLSHPNIAEVRAAFVCGDVGVLDMPLYAYSGLLQWSQAVKVDVGRKLVVLRQTLCGLEHVHRSGVVHGDIKPDNVFVTADGVAKLGDFDVSKDLTAAGTTTMVGVSALYAAPEFFGALPTPSFASDIYAFALTAFDVFVSDGLALQRTKSVDVDLGALKPHEPDSARVTLLQDLLRPALANAPDARPTATLLLSNRVFAAAAAAAVPAVEKAECWACCDKFWPAQGLACKAGHFVCSADLRVYGEQFCAQPLADAARRGSLKCPVRDCDAASAWSSAELAGALPPDVFAQYIKKLQDVSESRVLADEQQRHRAEMARLVRGEFTAEEHRAAIIERVMYLRCPRCEAVFVDFQGCFALTCGKCKAAFCAWCLQDFGDSAQCHRHLASGCSRAQTQSANTMYGTLDEFHASHRQRQTHELRRALERVKPAMRDQVRAALKKDLPDLDF